MEKMTLTQASHFMGLKPSFIKDAPISGVAVDSRLLKPHNLFFALPGARVDGHAFLAEIASKGALAAVVSNSYTGSDFGIPLIRVENPLLSLQKLASQFLKESKLKVVGVTGSLGKTTTKDFIQTLLQVKFRVASSPGNSNSKIGLPLTLLNHVKGTEEIIILEMGMTHPGDITELVNIAPPDVAIITTVALVHACNFDSLKEIAQAKAEILTHSKTSLGIISKDMDHYSEIFKTGSCAKTSFSTTSSDADFYLQETGKELLIRSRSDNTILPCLNIPGKHNLHNFLAAVATVRTFGLNWEEIINGMQSLSLPERRLQHIEKNGILFVNDAYNASPVSTKAALTSLPAPKPGCKRIAVLGDMLELGKLSEECHKDVGKAALQYVDNMICVGPACGPILECWQEAKRPVIWVNKVEEAAEKLKEQMKPGDVVLLKASRAIGLNRILEILFN
jgi:UDP-N-acetylmuramoyl-tripeptide--D-alanyl-D-alanine ligase